jgi:hypothetical protein
VAHGQHGPTDPLLITLTDATGEVVIASRSRWINCRRMRRDGPEAHLEPLAVADHPDTELVRQAMLVCTILCGFSVQAVVRLVASPPIGDRSSAPVLALFATGALVLLYALSAGVVYFAATDASADERSDLAVDVAYGWIIGLVLFLVGLICLIDLHSRRLARLVSVLSVILLVLFVRLLIIGF